MKRDIVENQGSATYQVFHEKTSFLVQKYDLVCLKLCPKLFDHPKWWIKKNEGTHKGRIEEDWGCQQFYNGIENFLELH